MEINKPLDFKDLESSSEMLEYYYQNVKKTYMIRPMLVVLLEYFLRPTYKESWAH